MQTLGTCKMLLPTGNVCVISGAWTHLRVPTTIYIYIYFLNNLTSMLRSMYHIFAILVTPYTPPPLSPSLSPFFFWNFLYIFFHFLVTPTLKGLFTCELILSSILSITWKTCSSVCIFIWQKPQGWFLSFFEMKRLILSLDSYIIERLNSGGENC